MPPGYTEARNAGSESEWLRPIYLGESFEVECEIVDVYTRRGKTGRVTIFAVREERLLDEAGEVCFRRRQTIAYFEPAPARSSSAEG